jgi:hypothetical protein
MPAVARAVAAASLEAVLRLAAVVVRAVVVAVLHQRLMPA